MGAQNTKEFDNNGNVKLPGVTEKIALKKNIPTSSDFEKIFDTRYAPYGLKNDYDNYKTTYTNNFNTFKTDYESNKKLKNDSFNTFQETINNNFNSIYSYITSQSPPSTTLEIYNISTKFNVPLKTNFTERYSDYKYNITGTITNFNPSVGDIVSPRWISFVVIDITEKPNYLDILKSLNSSNTYYPDPVTTGRFISYNTNPTSIDSKVNNYDTIKTLGAVISGGLVYATINMGVVLDQLKTPNVSTSVGNSFVIKGGHKFIFALCSNMPGYCDPAIYKCAIPIFKIAVESEKI